MFRAAQIGLRQAGTVRYAHTEVGKAANRAAAHVQKGGAYNASEAAGSAYGSARESVAEVAGGTASNASSTYGYTGNNADEALGQVAGNARSAYGSARGNAEEALGGAAGHARSAYGSARGNAEEALGDVAGSAKSAYGSARGSAKETLGEAGGKAEQLKGEAKGAASNLSHQAQGVAASATGQAKGAASEAERNVKDAAHQAKQAVTPPSAPVVIGKPTIRRPIGSVRGGMMGFLLGFGIASSYGYYYLLKEYNAASNLMLASVEELQSSTDKITTHLQRLNKLEADLKSLSSGSASKSDYEKNRSEMKRIIDGLHDEVLDVKKRVIG